MARFCGHYWAFYRLGNEAAAARAKVFAAREFHRCHWRHAPWRGANLGGWFLLEPGPASPLFDSVKEMCGSGVEVGGTEWDLCAALDALDAKAALAEKGAEQQGAAVTSAKAKVLDEHRATHYTSETMAHIKAAGLNAVRIPFGYWIITGATQGDRYHGPCLDMLDKAVDMAATAGLQVVLDLHGCPGGENGLRPCGRERAGWAYQDWRVEESLEVLRRVASRYKDAAAVTGIQVCFYPCL
jgi:glucan 1,3-beta-glucosidase